MVDSKKRVRRFFNPVILTQSFVQYRNPEGYFWLPTSRLPFQFSNLTLILLKNPESRASNGGNPVSRKTYWGPQQGSLICQNLNTDDKRSSEERERERESDIRSSECGIIVEKERDIYFYFINSPE